MLPNKLGLFSVAKLICKNRVANSDSDKETDTEDPRRYKKNRQRSCYTQAINKASIWVNCISINLFCPGKNSEYILSLWNRFYTSLRFAKFGASLMTLSSSSSSLAGNIMAHEATGTDLFYSDKTWPKSI